MKDSEGKRERDGLKEGQRNIQRLNAWYPPWPGSPNENIIPLQTNDDKNERERQQQRRTSDRVGAQIAKSLRHDNKGGHTGGKQRTHSAMQSPPVLE